MIANEQQELIARFLRETNRPIFLTGKAGTGKTTFLRAVQSTITKNLAIVAPTAVAAINAGGVTIHSFFQVPFGPLAPEKDNQPTDSSTLKPVTHEKSKLLKCLDLLIIDEISMVRADTLDYIDSLLRQVKGSARPFGGVQLLMIGDLFQLPPVYEKDWPVLRNFYDGPYFFNSLAFKKIPLLTFELTKVYRQSDPVFIEILNGIRNGIADPEMLKKLNAQYDPGLNDQWRKDYVTLSTHNQLVNEINQVRLKELDGEAYTFKAGVKGDFPKEGYPAEEELVLKPGAQVMFIKNDSSGKKQYYNGRTASITSLSSTSIMLSFLDDGSEFEVLQETWQNVKYTLAEGDQKINESNNGSFSQYPLRLAWAITIHKSQGLTFDKAIIDVAAAFAFGQTYVALSRCRTLEGMVLKAPVRPQNVKTDPQIVGFMQNAVIEPPNEELLQKSIRDFELEVLTDIFDFKVLTIGWEQLVKILMIGETHQSVISTGMQQASDLLNNEIRAIGNRFIKKELSALADEQQLWNNKEFISRLKKAIAYFMPKLHSFSALLDGFYTIKANEGLPEYFYETLNHLLVHLKAKEAAFIRMSFANSANDILSSVQEAGVLFQPIFKNWNLKALPKEKEIINLELYQQLIKFRNEISKERKVQEHMLISENVIREIANKIPRALNQLSQIKGFGEVKAADFGEQVLKIIRNYLGESELF